MEPFSVRERAIGLNLERPDPAAGVIGHIEQGLVGRQTDSVRELDSLIYDDALRAGAVDQPDLLSAGIAEVDFTAASDGQVIRSHALREHGFLSVRRIRYDPLAAILAGVQAAIGSEHQAVCAAGILL